jgi:hypothetical protein
MVSKMIVGDKMTPKAKAVGGAANMLLLLCGKND